MSANAEGASPTIDGESASLSLKVVKNIWRKYPNLDITKTVDVCSPSSADIHGLVLNLGVESIRTTSPNVQIRIYIFTLLMLETALYCAITALDGYPSHSDNIHYIWSATLIYALLPSTDHAITSILNAPYIRLLLLADICLFPSRAT